MSKSQKSTPKKRMHISKALKFRFDKKGALTASLSKSSGDFFLTDEVLKIISLVGEGCPPVEISEGLKKRVESERKNLPSEGEISEILSDLKGAGLILDEESASASSHLQGDGFGDPWIQWAMLADKARCLAYQTAIGKAVSQNTTVLDVGAGAGFLSACALNAGAKKVMAVEETAAALTVTRTLKNVCQKVDERFSLQNMNSADAEIPSDVGLVVSELFGNDPFQEGVLRTLREIASRVNLKTTKFIPAHLSVHLELIDLKEGSIFGRVSAWCATKTQEKKSDLENNFYERFLASAKSSLDFETLSFPYSLKKEHYRTASLAEVLAKISLSPPAFDLEFKGERDIIATQDTQCPIILMWFRVHLDSTITLSSNPHDADHASHWSPVLIPLKNAITESDHLQVKYHLNEDEDFLNVDVYKNGKKIGAK